MEEIQAKIKMAEKQDEAKDLQLELYAKFFSGLAHPVRLAIVEQLLDGEKNVSELVDLVGGSQSKISNHLACLKWCGYVNNRQEGKYVYYYIADRRVQKLVSLANEIVADNAAFIATCTRM